MRWWPSPTKNKSFGPGGIIARSSFRAWSPKSCVSSTTMALHPVASRPATNSAATSLSTHVAHFGERDR
jgi:hypothetical protein